MKIFLLFIIGLFVFSCSTKTERLEKTLPSYQIFVTDSLISGCYSGPEFVSESERLQYGLSSTDIAHQFSNKMVDTIGKVLKIKYREGKFSKIDLENIQMKTLNMDNMDDVEFCLSFPVLRVDKKMAMTGFEHCGGWNHDVGNLLEIRIQKLEKIALPSMIELSSKKMTEEGLIEYWIQFQHINFY